MELMNSKISRSCNAVVNTYNKLTSNQKTLAQTVLALALVAVPELSFAQYNGGGTGFFCYIAQYFKQIVGSAALVAITMWAIEHIFGASKLHDVVIKVGVSCAMVIGGATLINSSGLTSSCGF